MSEPCEKCGADISYQSEVHTNCDEVVALRVQVVKLEYVVRQLEHALWQLSRGMSEGEDTHPLVPASQVRDARKALALCKELIK